MAGVRFKVGQLLCSLVILAALPVTAQAAGPRPFLSRFSTVATLGSTVPANGDVNPYGIAVVPRTVGRLQKGDVLVSNFNNSANLQGLGSTIVEISPSGGVTLFATIDPAGRAGCAAVSDGKDSLNVAAASVPAACRNRRRGSDFWRMTNFRFQCHV